jgi:hypothetical protein
MIPKSLLVLSGAVAAGIVTAVIVSKKPASPSR